MKPNHPHKLLLICVALFFSLACNILAPRPVSTPMPPSPTSTPIPLSKLVTLVSKELNETNQTPPFTIEAQTPQLTGNEDARVIAFNQRLSQLVTTEVDTWRQSFLQITAPNIGKGSSLDITFTPLSQIGDLWSFKFDFRFYSDGAAHPGLYSITINYDLNQGRELTLADLFLPNSNYLEVISKYCITELGKQPGFEGPFAEGAKPTPENYHNWNIAPEGLLITFDMYQVAPGASGPQQVLIPYAELRGIIDPGGVLGQFKQ